MPSRASRSGTSRDDEVSGVDARFIGAPAALAPTSRPCQNPRPFGLDHGRYLPGHQLQRRQFGGSRPVGTDKEVADTQLEAVAGYMADGGGVVGSIAG